MLQCHIIQHLAKTLQNVCVDAAIIMVLHEYYSMSLSHSLIL